MRISERAQQLRALALRIAGSQEAEWLAVAATGSAARGDASEASDLDLWAIAAHDEVLDFEQEGVPVTVFAQTLETARHLDNLALFEVDDLWIVRDPEDLFADIRERYRSHREELRRRIIDATVANTFTMMQLAHRHSGLAAHVNLLEAALSVASIEPFLRAGRRVSKYRHFADEYQPAVLAAVRESLWLERERYEPGALEEWVCQMSVVADRLLRSRGLRTPSHPGAALKKLQQGAIEDGVLALRKHLEDEVSVPLSAAIGGDAVTAVLAHLPSSMTGYLSVLYGVPLGTEPDAAELARTRRAIGRVVAATRAGEILTIGYYLSR